MKKLTTLFSLLCIFCLSQCAIANRNNHDQKIILDAINHYRSEHRLSPVKLNKFISIQAMNHSRDMAEKKVAFGHHGFKKRANSIFSKFKHPHAVAENVAYIDGNIKDVVKLWLNSRGHRKNIEGHYNLTGIGIAYDKNGIAFVTQIFLNV